MARTKQTARVHHEKTPTPSPVHSAPTPTPPSRPVQARRKPDNDSSSLSRAQVRPFRVRKSRRRAPVARAPAPPPLLNQAPIIDLTIEGLHTFSPPQAPPSLAMKSKKSSGTTVRLSVCW